MYLLKFKRKNEDEFKTVTIFDNEYNEHKENTLKRFENIENYVPTQEDRDSILNKDIHSELLYNHINDLYLSLEETRDMYDNFNLWIEENIDYSLIETPFKKLYIYQRDRPSWDEYRTLLICAWNEYDAKKYADSYHSDFYLDKEVGEAFKDIEIGVVMSDYQNG